MKKQSQNDKNNVFRYVVSSQREKSWIIKIASRYLFKEKAVA
jgi:hypothetical protein